jgi:hypothetical protein
MRVTVEFEVAPQVRIHSPWPIEAEGKALFLKVDDDDVLTSITVVYRNIPLDQAPRVERRDEGRIKANIQIVDGYRLDAERTLRAWQSLLVTYTLIPIDWESAVVRYAPETSQEDGKIQLTKFSGRNVRRIPRGFEDFSIYGRAFLAVSQGYDKIDEMAFYAGGVAALQSQRPIDAYNNFYLYVEAKYGLRFRTRDAVKDLLSQVEFMAALEQVCREFPEQQKLRFKHLHLQDRGKLVREIVELRGFLRHNSLQNPARWDPNRQQEYDPEARFLASVAQDIAKRETFEITWGDPYMTEFVRQAEETGNMVEVHAILTIREADEVREVGLNLRFPQHGASPGLAHAALQKVIEEFNSRSPGAELFAIRARLHPNGPELFRYDVGPVLARN